MQFTITSEIAIDDSDSLKNSLYVDIKEVEIYDLTYENHVHFKEIH